MSLAHLSRGSSSSGTWRSRPIFISSTFRDMHAERDYLRAHVFPRLEEDLRARRHFLEPIDLRLGVETVQEGTEEARELLVLKVCLDEIVRSRPFMLVLLGDRYGWVPSEERLVAAAREQGLQIAAAGRSVTALEIEFGILTEDPSQRERTVFLFRRPLPYADMPAGIAAVYSDAHSADASVREGQGRLEALKQRIRCDPALGSRVFDYSVAWNREASAISGLEAFGELAYQKLWAALDQETAAFAARPVPTWQEQERTALDEFIEHRRRDFVGRDTLLGRLQDIVSGSSEIGAPLGACVTGPPGSGKSALFAELHRRLTLDGTTLVLANAAGASTHGSRVDAMLRRWIDEMAVHLGMASPLADDATPDDVEAAFYLALHQASEKTRVAVLVDALNQFETTPRGVHATWFRPARWPRNASLIATSLPGVAAESLATWAGIEEVEVPALTSDDVVAVAKAIWRRYHREVNPDVVRVLAEKHAPNGQPASGNALWLTLALEELNLLDADDFARADRDFTGSPAERLRALILDTAQRLPDDVEGLYAWLLARNEKVFGAAAQSFAVAIALSQHGWRETDLARIVPRLASVLTPAEAAVAVDDLHLAALRRGFRAHVIRRGELGQLDLAHAQMRNAVQARYLGDETRRRTLHARVSDYLETLDANAPVNEIERMWQLIGEGNVARAANYYATVDAPAPTPGEERVGSTWTLVDWIAGDESRRAAHPESPDEGSLAWTASWLDDPSLTPASRHQLATNFIWGVLDRLPGAVGVDGQLRLAEATERAMVKVTAAGPGRAAWQRNLSVSQLRVGDILVAQGSLAAALDAYRRGSAIAEGLAATDAGSVDWQRDLSVSYLKVGDALVSQGNLAGALDAFQRGLAIRERLAAAHPGQAVWQRDLSVSHDRVGDVLAAQGNSAQALEAYGRGLEITERLAASDPANPSSQRDVAASCDRIGDLLVTQGNLAAALDAYRRGLATFERLVAADPANAEWQRDLSASHNRIGDVLVTQGDLAGALEAYQHGLVIRERLAEADPGNAAWQYDAGISNERLGDVAAAQGRLHDATTYFLRKQAILERLVAADPGNAAWARDLAVSVVKIGDVLAAQGNPDEALDAFRHALARFEALAAANPGNSEGQRDTSVSHSKVGDMLAAQGNLHEAAESYQRGLAIAEHLAAAEAGHTEWQRDLAVSHYKLAGLAQQRGDVALMWAELRKSYAVFSVMDSRGVQFDPAAQEVYEQLADVLRDRDIPGRRSPRVAGADVPQPYPRADPDAAARVNIEYQQAMAAWKSLSWWERMRTAKPEPPRGI